MSKRAKPTPQREIKVWDTTTGALLLDRLVPERPTRGLSGAVTLSPDGRWVAFDEYDVAGGSARVQVCDVALGADAAAPPRWSLPATIAYLRCLAFRDDGHLLAVADEKSRVTIWNLSTSQPLHPRPLQAPIFLHGLTFSPDRTRLAGVTRAEVIVLDVATGHEVLTLRGAPLAKGDKGFNPQLAWSPDGQYLAASQWNNTVAIWHAPPFDSTK
jgi:WD40 repeat protein